MTGDLRVTEALAEFLVASRWADIPEAVRRDGGIHSVAVQRDIQLVGSGIQPQIHGRSLGELVAYHDPVG